MPKIARQLLDVTEELVTASGTDKDIHTKPLKGEDADHNKVAPSKDKVTGVMPPKDDETGEPNKGPEYNEA